MLTYEDWGTIMCVHASYKSPSGNGNCILFQANKNGVLGIQIAWLDFVFLKDLSDGSMGLGD